MRNKEIFLILSFLAIILICLAILLSKNNKIVTTSVTTVNNKKIGWGIKRNDNYEQPDLGAENQKLIDENEDIAIGNKEKPYIYLTFDEGYEAGYTPKILDTLKENNVKATFFITGHYLNSAGDLVKRMIDEGHIVGNHTVNHKSMPDLSDEMLKDEVRKLHTAVFEKFGYEMKYLRPPMGEFSNRTLELTKNLGYTTVMWSFAYDDWDESKQGREEYATKKILNNTHNGCVMLLHANSKDNADILDSVIKEIKKEGYEFRSLDEFVR